MLQLERAQSVRQQHGDGHRTDAAGNRSDRAGDLHGFAEANITDQTVAALGGWIINVVDAHIDDRGAWLVQSPRTYSGLPIAATRMSARRTTSAMFGVRLWQIVTVASRLLSRAATGMPTMLLRPRTTAVAPAIGTPLRSSKTMQPAGCKG